MQRRSHSIPEPISERAQVGPAPWGDSPVSGVDDEFWVLTTDAGRRLLAEVAAVRAIRPVELDRFRRLASPAAVAAAIRVSMARQKAKAKFERGERMWVEPIGVEQATGEVVARHKAARFAAGPMVLDLCAGIGGDALALAVRTWVLAVDLDPAMCRRLRWNATVYDVADRILAIRGRAENFPFPKGAWLHLDPDRRGLRSRSRPTRALDNYTPAPPSWDRIRRRAAAGAIKLSPAGDWARHFLGPEYEIELISLRGECKEATVWFGAPVSCRRRATRLPEGVTWTERDGGMPEPEPVSPLLSWIYDPDPSLIRAGLLDGFAQAHGLRRVVEGVDYLTADERVETPFLDAFAVRDVSPLDSKHLRRMIQAHRVGALEIKVRGVDLAPEALRARLKPRGAETEMATLLVIGGAGPVRAVLTQRGLR
jgi:hypothetical protein